jgi:hypothetical protein
VEDRGRREANDFVVGNAELVGTGDGADDVQDVAPTLTLAAGTVAPVSSRPGRKSAPGSAMRNCP